MANLTSPEFTLTSGIQANIMLTNGPALEGDPVMHIDPAAEALVSALSANAVGTPQNDQGLGV